MSNKTSASPVLSSESGPEDKRPNTVVPGVGGGWFQEPPKIPKSTDSQVP